MENTTDIQVLFDLFKTIRLFLGRPVVQYQLAAIVLALLVAWLLLKGLWTLIARQTNIVSPILTPSSLSGTSPLPPAYRRAIVVAQAVTYPLLAIASLYGAYYIFDNQGWFTGVLRDFIFLLWLLLAYRLLIALFYEAFGESTRRYHLRLLAPLFVVIVILQALSQFIDLSTLARVGLFTLFDNPTTLGALLMATVGLYFWIDASWAIQDILQSVLTSRTTTDLGTLEASLTISRYIIISIGLLIVLGSLGFDTTTLAAITGGLSVGITFALQDVLSNFASGILLLFERSLRPGDIVEIEGQMGIVQSLSIRSTTLRTLNNVELIVPNQTFLTSAVTTYTKSNRLVRVLIPVGVTEENDPEKVIQILLSIARQHRLVEEEPQPQAFLMGFEEAIDLELAVWLNDPTKLRVLTSDLNLMIWKEFSERGIEMSNPQQEVYIRGRMSIEDA